MPQKKKRGPRHAPKARFERHAQQSAKPAEPNPWEVLTALIQDYADASVAESWKGGGDPADIPVLDLQLELARSKLNRHLEKMRELV